MTNKVWSKKTALINTYTVYYRIRMCPVSSRFTFIKIIPCFWPLWYLIISEHFDISCNNFAIIFVTIKLATQTILKSPSLELKSRKFSDLKVMLKSEFAKKKSLSLKLEKVGIGHPPAQTPMSEHGSAKCQTFADPPPPKVDDIIYEQPQTFEALKP